jgi:hypothetical protein
MFFFFFFFGTNQRKPLIAKRRKVQIQSNPGKGRQTKTGPGPAQKGTKTRILTYARSGALSMPRDVEVAAGTEGREVAPVGFKLR